MNDFINVNLNNKVQTMPMSGQQVAVVNAASNPISSTNHSNNTQVPAENQLQSYPANYYIDSVKKTYPKDRVMYKTLKNSLDTEGRNYLKQLHKNGKLYSRESNDGSSTLENLYNIATTPRIQEFDSKNILKETLKTMNDPYVITQNFGQIEPNFLVKLVGAENQKLQTRLQQAQTQKGFNPDDIGDTYPINPENVKDIHSAVCPAASIEFNMADRKPAEFTRYVEGLTGPNKSVKTSLKSVDLSPSRTDAMAALIDQKTPHKYLDWDTIEVTLKPDENAYIRANVQEDTRAKNSRSMVDVLMQSAFMQLGSRQTYNTLTDTRSKDVGDGGGLNQFEIAFVESIVDSESRKVPVVYMELDDDITQVTQYNYDFENTKQQFVKSLDMGKNIITGFLIDVDKNGKINYPGGHEVLLTGYKYDKQGDLMFKYNDTDDGDYFAPSWIKADEFIPKVHHANIPQGVLQGPLEEAPDQGYQTLQEYRFMKGFKTTS